MNDFNSFPVFLLLGSLLFVSVFSMPDEKIPEGAKEKPLTFPEYRVEYDNDGDALTGERD